MKARTFSSLTTIKLFAGPAQQAFAKEIAFQIGRSLFFYRPLALMDNTYLQSLQELTQRKISDFDSQRLYTDVRKVFVEKSWLNVVASY